MVVAIPLTVRPHDVGCAEGPGMFEQFDTSRIEPVAYLVEIVDVAGKLRDREDDLDHRP
ncbi:MAG: hypothetical protein R3A46_19695 [Thermomicrobiales bacterium]